MIDILVIGGGHAGVEAALASARLNKNTVLYTNTIDMIASMPCNPSVGGPAKGIVVREIDALGGEMGKAADATALQFKMLNTTKGPGVHCLRVQSDKIAYKKYMQTVLQQQKNLTLKQTMVKRVVAENGKITGIIEADGTFVAAKVVILTSGTFMSATILIGHTSIASGAENEPTTTTLSQSLRDLGIQTFRLKTGTPARVKRDSIDFSKTEIQPGTDAFVSFSYETKSIRPYHEQLPCYLTYTTSKTHEIILKNLSNSSMYSGLVKGVGPRYCPSIEDKLVRFQDKERHQIFLEPESESLDTIYVQGFSTSMPEEIQDEMLRSIPGLEQCEVEKYGYAIEYDACDPLQMKPSLESKVVENLFTAGQVNGTSGYEEAAGQGLIAAINAVRKLNQEEPLVLRRDEAYLGVLIDDLVTKGTKEPYRLLTSRAEYRLLLRHDNADDRLSEYGYQIGLLSEDRYRVFQKKKQEIQQLKDILSSTSISMKSNFNQYLNQIGYENMKDSMKAIELLRRPNVEIEALLQEMQLSEEFSEEVKQSVQIDVKYEGYIEKAKRDAKHLVQMEKMKIPKNLDYASLQHLSLEAKQKLQEVQPLTLGQASRISGVTPADISVLSMYIQMKK